MRNPYVDNLADYFPRWPHDIEKLVDKQGNDMLIGYAENRTIITGIVIFPLTRWKRMWNLLLVKLGRKKMYDKQG